MLTGLVATAVAFGLVLLLAVITARGPEDGAVPDRGTEWGALDTGRIEDRIREHLGGGERDADLLELARHHAFDRAARDWAGEVSPEGEGHDGRRARLAPTFVGTSSEVGLAMVRPRGAREDEVADLVTGELARPESDAATVEVGVACEQGRVAVTIVRGRRVATLDSPPILEVSGGLWSLSGVMSGGRGPERIEATLQPGSGPPMSAGTSTRRGELPDDPDCAARWILELTLPEGDDSLVARLHCEGDVVLVVPVRT